MNTSINKIGIAIDYSNICKDFNTVYLDRDNTDRATSKCMNAVLEWMSSFVADMLENFGGKLYSLSTPTPLKIEEVASKRFLFYSLEKEILLQSFVVQPEYVHYDNSTAWATQSNDSILIQNDEDGGGVYFYCTENSTIHQWIVSTLKNFSLDEVPFEVK